MSFLDHLQLALFSLRSSLFRTFLTTLGIIIGVMAVITLVSVGKSAQESIEGTFDSFGSNTIYAIPGSPDATQGGPPNLSDTFTLNEMERIYDFPKRYITAVAGQTFIQKTVTYKESKAVREIIGNYGDYAEVQNFVAEYGRLFDEADYDKVARVAIIGPDLIDDFFDGNIPIGEEIKIDSTTFRIVGVIEKKGSSSFDNPNDDIYIPYSAYNTYIVNNNSLSIITFKAQNADLVERAKEEGREIFRKVRRIDEDQEDDFTVRDAGEILSSINQVTGILTGFLSAVAAVSLLVGGIGVMNIMFVSITERTKEIGLRKSLGANNSDIMIQFLTESVVVTMLGGIIGIILGILLSFVINGFLALDSGIYPDTILLGVAFSIGVGLIFGIYPALKASKLNPIDALRYE